MKITAKIALIALVAGGLFAQAALAADPVDRRQNKNVFQDAPLAPAKTWTGPWIGANIGYGIAMVDLPGPLDLAAPDWTFGVSGGFDAQLGAHWVVGAFGDYEWAKQLDLDNGAWTGGVRAGYLLTPSTLVYALGGYSQSIKHSELSGMTLGGGLEFRLTDNWSTKLEYRHIFVDSPLPVDLDVHQMRLGISHKFN